jgi:hypothetical protein
MTDTTAFIQNGATVAITANTSAPTAVQILPTFTASLPPRNQFRIVNSGTVTLFLGVGPTAAIAATNAAAVTTTGNAIPVLANGVEILTFPPSSFFTATAASAATLYITPGEGL